MGQTSRSARVLQDPLRREFIALGLLAPKNPEPLRPIVISVQAMFDKGAHSGKGLGEGELSKFRNYQEKARREYATSGIRFDIRVLEGGYLRQQGYSEIPPKFLAPGTINLFVTDTLGYDIDRDRTGGCSIGPRPPSRRSGGDPFYKTFLGLRDATPRWYMSMRITSLWTRDEIQRPPATSGPIFGMTTGFGCSATVCRFWSSVLAPMRNGRGSGAGLQRGRPTSTSACSCSDMADFVARRAGPGGPAQTWRSAPRILQHYRYWENYAALG